MVTTSSLAPTVIAPALNLDEVQRLLTKYDYDDAIHQKHYSYGTAGFRYLAVELPPVLLRVGLAAAVLARQSHQAGGGAIGVMITASHNTAEYNGVKLAGTDGGMIDAASEQVAVQIVNERDTSQLLAYVRPSSGTPGVVHIGRDTRDHSVSLACLVVKAIVALGCSVVDHGVVTTPMLHHCVSHANAASAHQLLPTVIPLRLDTAGYYDLLVHSYVALLATKDEASSAEYWDPVLTVDCACGVGYPHLQALLTRLEQSAACGRRRTIVAVNAPLAGPLNEACGSECVQKEQRPCTWYDAEATANGSIATRYCASLDGDADRIVFFSVTDDGNFVLLDGDKMACLIGNFLRDQLTNVVNACGGSGSASTLPTISLGVVQTAYANGASTAYLTSQGVSTCIAKTGVKHVHAAAHDNFDIGVYFEANGHGTVLFGPAYYTFLHAAESALRRLTGPPPTAALRSLQRLRVLPALINQAVGDSLSDLLLVDAILQLQGWDIVHWARALYQDLPSRQLKVKVVDRTVICTNDNETVCLSPPSVQTELQAAMQRCEQGRAFVRPSGTEDVVRIYAEAATSSMADELAARAAEIVHRLCGGIGEAPPLNPHSRM